MTVSPKDTLLWELEHHRGLVEPTALPRVEAEPPMPPSDFDALVRATRWGALTPFLSPDGATPPEAPPLLSPAFGAVQVEDFQLVPVLKALQMPRVSLLLADDVGLGKTVEAGLLMAELLQHRASAASSSSARSRYASSGSCAPCRSRLGPASAPSRKPSPRSSGP